ncbi:MAG: type II toxin-antitoxin system RelE/ParE family toxin [Verrucomicrobiaceae bacterium]|nr:type II toxin-antitoxin system RelE/ParE family toxin [Verrucomicrobiaceae bacterium]
MRFSSSAPPRKPTAGPKRIHDQVIDRIGALAENPRPTGCRKLSGSENDWRIRVGDYRFIYEIADVIRAVRVHRIRHRREVTARNSALSVFALSEGAL